MLPSKFLLECRHVYRDGDPESDKTVGERQLRELQGTEFVKFMQIVSEQEKAFVVEEAKEKERALKYRELNYKKLQDRVKELEEELARVNSKHEKVERDIYIDRGHLDEFRSWLTEAAEGVGGESSLAGGSLGHMDEACPSEGGVCSVCG